MTDSSLLLEHKHHPRHGRHAVVIGSGPNGLSAAIVLAEAGYGVDVYEAQSIIGGGARTLPLTLPGFHHDFGSAIHAIAAGSPFFAKLSLQQNGVEWIHPAAPLAHPLDDSTAVMLERNLGDAAHALDPDGNRWSGLFKPLADHWHDLSKEVLQPILHFPRHPLLLARFGIPAGLPTNFLTPLVFKSLRTRALFAGIAAHSFLPLNAPLSSSAAILLAAAAHAVGWPMARGGAQSITNALASILQSLGGRIHVNSPVDSLDAFHRDTLFLCDISPQQLIAISGHRLSRDFRQKLSSFAPGPGAFKIDYALSHAIPWKAQDCLRGGT
ncbi:MAG TPA: NAD(P)/FAD-dependent oxidoreductase, partial [Alloacidobacterium sp.]|nr:NAD(P)/FAD-dependent oxidoreductase [Alloacidobacterium sp.]